jgi:hypothetical protein
VRRPSRHRPAHAAGGDGCALDGVISLSMSMKLLANRPTDYDAVHLHIISRCGCCGQAEDPGKHAEIGRGDRSDAIDVQQRKSPGFVL